MKRWILVLVPLLALGGLIAWRLHTETVQGADQTKMRQARAKAAPMVSVAPARVRDIVHSFEGVASIDAPLNVKLAPKVPGRIIYLEAHEGDRVRRGEVLVRLD